MWGPSLFGQRSNLTPSRFRRDAEESYKIVCARSKEKLCDNFLNLSFFLAAYNKTFKITLYHLKIWNL
jgi:hypothetical protein